MGDRPLSSRLDSTPSRPGSLVRPAGPAVHGRRPVLRTVGKAEPWVVGAMFLGFFGVFRAVFVVAFAVFGGFPCCLCWVAFAVFGGFPCCLCWVAVTRCGSSLGIMGD